MADERTPDEVSPEVKKHYDEMVKKGAAVEGEGEITPKDAPEPEPTDR